MDSDHFMDAYASLTATNPFCITYADLRTFYHTAYATTSHHRNTDAETPPPLGGDPVAYIGWFSSLRGMPRWHLLSVFGHVVHEFNHAQHAAAMREAVAWHSWWAKELLLDPSVHPPAAALA